MIRTKKKSKTYVVEREDEDEKNKCEAKPLAKFGIDYNKYLGCNWCKVKRECSKQVLKGMEKKHG